MGKLEGRPAVRVDGARRVLLSYAPATGELLGEAPCLEPDEVRSAVARACAAQGAWAKLSIEERCEQILVFRDAIVEHAEELCELIVSETGKPRMEALLHEVLATTNFGSFYARRGPEILAPREVEIGLLRHRRSYVHYAPRGVIAIISPWNFPLMIAFSDVFAALVAGNAAVVKPSEVTPLIALRMKAVFDGTNLPKDLLQVVTGDASTGAALVDARPDKVVFTGSVAGGRRVAAACAERLIPSILELGGKAPAIICADADVERTARALVFGAFANSGQICVSVERVYVHTAIHDALVARIVELTKALGRGDPQSPTTEVGAMTFDHQLIVVERLLADAQAKGAEVKTGGVRGAPPAQSFEPTVLVRCTHEMAVMHEEIFGPVLPIMRVADEDEALRLANDSDLGLMAYVFGRDRDRTHRIAEAIRAGTVMVNDAIIGVAYETAPFGGVKQSGIGVLHGEEGLRAMCELRHVNYDRFSVPREPFAFPYRERFYRATLKGLRIFFRRGSTVKKILDLF